MKIQSLPKARICVLVFGTSCALATATLAVPKSTAPKVWPTPGPNYTASRFPGVTVRHVPHASSTRTAASTSTKKGPMLRNIRRAHNSRDGIIADVDPASLPSTVAFKDASGKLHIRSSGGGLDAVSAPKSTASKAKNRPVPSSKR